ncbi:MAG: uracil-DNA glycosylase [Nitrospirota bacterium]
MNSKAEMIKELRKAMEFYGELGFHYLPVKKSDISGHLSDLVSLQSDNDVPEKQAVVDRTDHDQNSEDALKSLREEIGDCRRCKLSEGRNNIVFGEGSPEADLMFIGEGPGRDEDIQARPFVGDAGKLLTKLIVKLGLKREGVYIANIVKCRPPNNRNPENDEIAVCRQFVEKQIEIIKPKVIVCLGKVSANALLRVITPISRMRGVFSDYKSIPVMPTFHPAYLLRNPKDKWLTWDDMQKVMGKLKK